MNADLIDVDLFAGPGGWDEGRRMAGATNFLFGIEHDLTACRTAREAGHARVCADVLRYPTGHLAGRILRLIASPPCTAFSSAGQGAGRKVIGILATAMTRIMRGRKAIRWAEREAARVLRAHALTANPTWTRARRATWAREQARLSVLVLQPARWVHDTRPRMVALEQVPGVLPLWRHLAELLREAGYRVWCGILSAEEYGVPQTRKRAILVASLDCAVGPPAPTHQLYQAGAESQSEPDLFGDPLPPPVSMAEALGWDEGAVSYKRTRGEGITERHGDRPDRPDRPDRAPAPTITSKSRSDTWALRNGNQTNACERSIDEPAGTLFFSKRGNAVDWVLSNGQQTNGTRRPAPAPTIYCSRAGNLQWVQERPATTVCGDPRIGRPGHKDREGGESQFAEASVRVSVAEASVLQSFPPDYPWQGSKSQQYAQVGNAVPVLLATAILEPLIRADQTPRRSA